MIIAASEVMIRNASDADRRKALAEACGDHGQHFTAAQINDALVLLDAADAHRGRLAGSKQWGDVWGCYPHGDVLPEVTALLKRIRQMPESPVDADPKQWPKRRLAEAMAAINDTEFEQSAWGRSETHMVQLIFSPHWRRRPGLALLRDALRLWRIKGHEIRAKAEAEKPGKAKNRASEVLRWARKLAASKGGRHVTK